jgi:hypothetical protein
MSTKCQLEIVVFAPFCASWQLRLRLNMKSTRTTRSDLFFVSHFSLVLASATEDVFFSETSGVSMKI